jgi:hypothetical protein
MRSMVLMATLVALATPAAAQQDWPGQPLVPLTITNLPGPNYTLSNAYSVNGPVGVGGTVQPLQPNCYHYTEFGGYFTSPPCGGAPTYYTPPVVNGQQPNTAYSVSAVPSGATAAGSQVGVYASGAYPDPSAPGGVSYFYGSIPLSDFATPQSMSALQSSVAALTSRVNSFIATQQAFNASVTQAQARLGRGVAMSTALALQGPLDGKDNRLSIGVGAFGDSNAVSLNYSHRAGPYDVGVAVSYAGGDSLEKAEVGLSW